MWTRSTGVYRKVLEGSILRNEESKRGFSRAAMNPSIICEVTEGLLRFLKNLIFIVTYFNGPLLRYPDLN